MGKRKPTRKTELHVAELVSAKLVREPGELLGVVSLDGDVTAAKLEKLLQRGRVMVVGGGVNVPAEVAIDGPGDDAGDKGVAGDGESAE